jgi:hypothetical protein
MHHSRRYSLVRLRPVASHAPRPGVAPAFGRSPSPEGRVSLVRASPEPRAVVCPPAGCAVLAVGCPMKAHGRARREAHAAVFMLSCPTRGLSSLVRGRAWSRLSAIAQSTRGPGGLAEPSPSRVGGAREWAALVGLAERGFQQASRITLTKSCRCDNSSGDGFAHRLPLAFAGGVESFSHRRNRLRFERSGLHE